LPPEKLVPPKCDRHYEVAPVRQASNTCADHRCLVSEITVLMKKEEGAEQSILVAVLVTTYMRRLVHEGDYNDRTKLVNQPGTLARSSVRW